MLKVENLTLHYGGSQILNGISLEAAAGPGDLPHRHEWRGQDQPSQGDFGHAYPVGRNPDAGWREHRQACRPQAMAKRGIGYVPQGRMIFPLLTVRENLETGFACLPKSEHRIPDEIFELFPVLKEMQNRRGGDLSGGQQQQLAIARALIMKPKVLLLDEPTEGIQPNIIQQIGRVIEYLRAKGDMAIVLVEQYFDFAYGLADRFYVLKRGSVALSGTKAEIPEATLRAAVSV